MPRQARKESRTGIYHVMLRGINRQDIFEDAEDYMRMLRCMLLISLYRYQVYHCNRYHASAAIGTVRIAANGPMIIGSA